MHPSFSMYAGLISYSSEQRPVDWQSSSSSRYITRQVKCNSHRGRPQCVVVIFSSLSSRCIYFTLVWLGCRAVKLRTLVCAVDRVLFSLYRMDFSALDFSFMDFSLNSKIALARINQERNQNYKRIWNIYKFSRWRQPCPRWQRRK